MNLLSDSIHQRLQRSHYWLRERGVESGYTIIFQATYYTFILFMLMGFIFDFGGVGYAIAIANNATRLAAQDAAKNIDVQRYIDDQEIRLNGDAEQVARDMVSGLTGGQVQVTGVSVNKMTTRDVITVQAQATVGLPILGTLFGLGDITIPVEAYAEPAFGVGEEGQ
jgi:hypothetical protein